MTREELAALAAPVAWSGDSVARLSEYAGSELTSRAGLDLDSYGTRRLLQRDPMAVRSPVGAWPAIPGFEFGVEALPDSLGHLAGNNGAELADTGDVDPEYMVSILRSACGLVSELSSELTASIRSLLRSVHILDCADPEVDLSFSLPELPHSVFVSVPPAGQADATARLAEAIVHEVLHLQLTLVEGICPIVRPDAEPEFKYAPWRGEVRPLGGVIHGLYVFRGVEVLWLRASASGRKDVHNFACRRVDEICHQRRQVRAGGFASLTTFGQEVLSRLMNP